MFWARPDMPTRIIRNNRARSFIASILVPLLQVASFVTSSIVKHPMRHLFTVTLLFFFCGMCCAQSLRDSTFYRKSVVEQAAMTGNALITKDYSTFVKFIHPSILSLSGGKQKMIAQLQKGIKEMEENGTSFSSVEFGTPDQILHAKGELQCIVTQYLTMKVPNGKLLVKSALIAVSTDKGRQWLFIDTAAGDLKTLQKVVPTLSDKLRIPAKEEPKFYLD